MRTLLIDADIIAFRASASTQEAYDWGDGETSTVADFEEAKRHARDTIDALMDTLDADRAVICLSDDFNNFRKRVCPTYKGNRTSERPVHLYDIKEWLAENYETERRGWLEADDIMGIMATEPHPGEERIIVSADKDMQTIPCLLYRPHLDRPKVETITPEFADRYHLYQTLVGDSTDGYPGCPGAGDVIATRLLDEGLKWSPVHREITRGPNKGVIRTTWELVPSESPWASVVSAYAKAGLKEKDALKQARLARILRHDEWNGRPILWSPPAPN
ncbi:MULTISPECIES: exonuclease [unclassified Caulobacter]|uniref:exonuclease n=1 Tax=unclassified Caulobacter TaxID=2648921 RepID=UPI001304CC51|nr:MULTISPECIES: exonuclease [unclassified Caulobacter]